MPSYIRLFCYISPSKNTKKKEMRRQYQVLRISNNVGLGGDLQPYPTSCTSLCSYCECFISEFINS
jgi:hypothetical protein